MDTFAESNLMDKPR